MMIKRTSRNSISGFSLMEALIGIAVLSILLAGISAAILYMEKQNAFIQLKLDYMNFQTEVSAAFRGDSSCLNNLVSNSVVLPATSLTLNNVRLYNSLNAAVGTVVPALNTGLVINNRLSVTSLTLANVKTLIPTKEYVVDVQVNVAHTLSPAPDLKPFTIEAIRITTTSAGVPILCNNTVKMACVTGFVRASDYPTFASGGTIKSNSDPTQVATFGTVFSVISDGQKWGLQCNSPHWMIASCSVSGLQTTGGIPAMYTIDSTYPTGCYALSPDIPATTTVNTGLYLTCCSSR